MNPDKVKAADLTGVERVGVINRNTCEKVSFFFLVPLSSCLPPLFLHCEPYLSTETLGPSFSDLMISLRHIILECL